MSASTSENLDLWYVKLPNGDVHRVTLDQLDGAFQGGRIDGRAMVMPVGADERTTWTSLSQLVGAEDEADEAEAGQAAAAPAVVQSYTPARAPAQAYAPAYAPARTCAPTQAYAVVPSVSPRAYAQVAPVSVTPPPVAYARVQAPAPMQAVGSSLRPMSFDLGNDDVDIPFQRKSRKGWAVAVLGLAAAAGVAGFMSTRQRSGGDDIATVAAAAAMAAPLSYAASPLPAAPPPQPAPIVGPPPSNGSTAQATALAEGSPLNPQFTSRFNETTKQKLLDADKARDEKARARHAAAGAYHPSHSSKSSGVFTSGGNKYDPLNSNL